MEERWLPVVGYEGQYEVSDMGRVRSVPRTEIDSIGRRKRIQGGLLRPSTLSTGYLAVKLPRGTKRVHSLVMESFKGPRPPDMFVLHKNGQKPDVRLANLRYGTPAENNADMKRHGRTVFGSKNYNAKLTDERVLAARALYDQVPLNRMAAAFEVAAPVLRNAAGRGYRLSWSHVQGELDLASAWRVLLVSERAARIRIALPFMVEALEGRRAAAAA